MIATIREIKIAVTDTTITESLPRIRMSKGHRAMEETFRSIMSSRNRWPMSFGTSSSARSWKTGANLSRSRLPSR